MKPEAWEANLNSQHMVGNQETLWIVTKVMGTDEDHPPPKKKGESGFEK